MRFCDHPSLVSGDMPMLYGAEDVGHGREPFCCFGQLAGLVSADADISESGGKDVGSVKLNLSISSDKYEVVSQRLGDEHPVERVSVVIGQRAG